MSEEPDYMSDDFLQSLCQTNDVRPGLPKSHRQEREQKMLEKKIKIEEANKKQKQSKATIENERLQKGLEEPIASSNKGFSMMQKMGFTPGTGLGKTKSGIIEPVTITVKNDRQGLGRAEILKQIKLQKKNIKLKHEQCNVDDYRSMMSKKSKEREVMCDLRKSQRICHQLDTSNNISTPAENWFWPEECLPEKKSEEDKSDNDDEDEEEEEFNDDADYEPDEKLEILTSYLRQTFCYCIWCGVQFEDEKDLQDCPGPTRGDH